MTRPDEPEQKNGPRCKHCDGIRIARRDMLGLGSGGLPALLGTAAWADCAPMTVQSVPGTN